MKHSHLLRTSAALLALTLCVCEPAIAATTKAPDKWEAAEAREKDGLGKDSSGKYRIVEGNVVVDEQSILSLGSNAKINTVVVTRGATLTLGTNPDIGVVRIDSAKSLLGTANAAIGSITGTAGAISVGASSTVGYLSASISGVTDIGSRANVGTAYLDTSTLRISANASIGSGTLVVYERLEGTVNPAFGGKLVIHSPGLSSERPKIAGRYCALGRIGTDTVAEREYPFVGLLGNVDPLLDTAVEDSSTAFAEIRQTAEGFDTQLAGGLRRLAESDRAMAAKQAELDRLEDESARREVRTEMDNIAIRKNVIETKLQTLLEDTFDRLDATVGEDMRTQALWSRVKSMYSLALTNRDIGQVYSLCANAVSTWDAGPAYLTGSEIRVGTRAVSRESTLSTEERQAIASKVAYLSPQRLADMQERLSAMKGRIAAKPAITQTDGRTLNLLLDIETALRDEMLYP